MAFQVPSKIAGHYGPRERQFSILLDIPVLGNINRNVQITRVQINVQGGRNLTDRKAMKTGVQDRLSHHNSPYVVESKTLNTI